MAVRRRLISARFPYLPLRVAVRHRAEDVEALLDTGFDGDVAVPPDFIRNGQPPDGHLPCRLADGSVLMAPYCRGTIQLGALGSFPIVCLALGDEVLVGRGVSDRFRVTLDHGQRLIVEP